jgi:hypothetical protein
MFLAGLSAALLARNTQPRETAVVQGGGTKTPKLRLTRYRVPAEETRKQDIHHLLRSIIAMRRKSANALWRVGLWVDGVTADLRGPIRGSSRPGRSATTRL